MFALHILLCQKQDPSKNEAYNLIKRCKCVEYFWWIVDELLCTIYLSPCIFFLDMGYIFFLLFSFSFNMYCGHVTYLFWVCIFSLSLALFFFVMPFGHVAYLLWVCIFSLFLFFFCHAFWACGIPSLGMHLFSFSFSSYIYIFS